MRYTDPDPEVAPNEQEKLRRENEELRRQLRELRGSGAAPAEKVWRPSGAAITATLLGLAVIAAIAFWSGYSPRRNRIAQIAAEAAARDEALPSVEVAEVTRAASDSALELAGSIQALAEAPVLARADGYLAKRLADIGDRVKAGEPLAEIDAPELDAQVRQSRAAVEQAKAAVEQGIADLERGKSDLELARVTAERWAKLAEEGVASKQENDAYQSQYKSRAAAALALEKAILSHRSAVAVAEANLARLEKIGSYRVVRAPFDGVITLRNVDPGALVNAGSTLLYRIAQIDNLRVYVNVPQSHAGAVRVGDAADIAVSNLPGRTFAGAVTRTAGALDPGSRTMLAEVSVRNSDRALMPGMYAQVGLHSGRAAPPLTIPADALIVRAEGTQVAVLREGGVIHLQPIRVARDYGARLEVAEGLQAGDVVVLNPGDIAREGAKVNPVRTASEAK
jgi:RND family efflux transporter MFP subunit